MCGLADDFDRRESVVEKEKRPAKADRLMEVPPRFELGSEGFADLCLTTWPWHHVYHCQENLTLVM